MADSNSTERSLARATIVAALIGVLGTVIGGVFGSRVGERRAGDEAQDLEARMRQQESAVEALHAQIAERDKAIRELTDQIARERAQTGLRNSANESPILTARGEEFSGSGQSIPTASKERGAPISVRRLAPVDIALEKCEHWGGGLSCRLLLKNTSSEATNIALEERSTFAYDEHANEYRLEQATLGSHRWSAAQFGAIRLEPNIPLAANFQFSGVPGDARQGPLRLVLAVVQVAGPPAFFGPNPNWQSIIFEDVPFE